MYGIIPNTNIATQTQPKIFKLARDSPNFVQSLVVYFVVVSLGVRCVGHAMPCHSVKDAAAAVVVSYMCELFAKFQIFMKLLKQYALACAAKMHGKKGSRSQTHTTHTTHTHRKLNAKLFVIR